MGRYWHWIWPIYDDLCGWKKEKLACYWISPRKNYLSLYILNGVDTYKAKLQTLGEYKLSKVCIYIKDMNKVDPAQLTEIIRDSYLAMKSKHPLDTSVKDH
ncbi:MAG: DUF1801 domain-containing protein [Chloroflexi bacterium]|nr:DUF1801 domain-containing protein [Chloroflexota bacterium]